MTTIRREVLTLPAAPLGPDNPLPPLRPLDEAHRIDERDRAGLPRDMARQVGYEPLRSLLPAPVRDGYGRVREPREFDALVIENDRLRATVLPALGGRVTSLFHKPTDRELLYVNPVLQPANFALNGAWFSGGIEWNIGATGHTTLSCSPVHAARVPAPDGGEMLRLWEWERLRDLPFQVDLWLPRDSDFLHVGVRVRNPHERPVPTYWWSNIAVPEDRRVLAPADEAWLFGYELRLRRVPVPTHDGADRTYPRNSAYAADWFYEVPDGRRRWIAALDEHGHGLVQTSTDVLRGRKLFVWGTGPGGRRWQEWLTEPGTGGYCEIQAGLARTQLEHVKLEAESEVSWLEAYGRSTRTRKGSGTPYCAEPRTGWRRSSRAPAWTRRTRPGAPTRTRSPASAWPPDRAGAPSKCSARAGSCPAPPSRRPPSVTSSGPGCTSCTPGRCPSRTPAHRPGARWSPGPGGTCWRPLPPHPSPSTTSVSPSGTKATGHRRCAAGSGA